MSTIQTNTFAGVLDVRDSSNNLTAMQVSALQGASTSTPPLFQDSVGTQVGTLCRAWVNFNGTGTVAIRAAFNVSSITDGGTGTYTANFINAMSDVNYSTVGCSKTADNSTAGGNNNSFAPYSFTAGSISMLSIDAGSGLTKDAAVMTVSVFR